jgi:hypothetical protein
MAGLILITFIDILAHLVFGLSYALACFFMFIAMMSLYRKALKLTPTLLSHREVLYVSAAIGDFAVAFFAIIMIFFGNKFDLSITQAFKFALLIAMGPCCVGQIFRGLLFLKPPPQNPVRSVASEPR